MVEYVLRNTAIQLLRRYWFLKRTPGRLYFFGDFPYGEIRFDCNVFIWANCRSKCKVEISNYRAKVLCPPCELRALLFFPDMFFTLHRVQCLPQWKPAFLSFVPFRCEVRHLHAGVRAGYVLHKFSLICSACVCGCMFVYGPRLSTQIRVRGRCRSLCTSTLVLPWIFLARSLFSRLFFVVVRVEIR